MNTGHLKWAAYLLNRRAAEILINPHNWGMVFVCLFVVLGVGDQTQASHKLGHFSITEPHPGTILIRPFYSVEQQRNRRSVHLLL